MNYCANLPLEKFIHSQKKYFKCLADINLNVVTELTEGELYHQYLPL